MKLLNIQIKNTGFVLALLATGISLFSCTSIPEPGSLAPDINYKNRKQYAISGMEQTIGDFEVSTSTLPLTFEIVNISETSGQDVSSLTQSVPVVRYTEPIDGNESAEELALKTDTVELPAVSVNENTGKIEIQQGNDIPAGEYHFDIQVSNTSGSKILEDAIIIEFTEYELVSWSSGMAQEPEIERVADSPNEVLFVGYLDGVALPGERIDFTKNRASGFAGTFVNDTEEGEIWSVDFPVEESETYCTWAVENTTDGTESYDYESESFTFVLGRPGSYVIRLYK
ncbi:DUF5007 domain-containing protein [Mangrovibacterium diazotrophicum]|uniref:Uncharacterized protein DUF5007 n=1 Tax=Mangrovibacterium diazotrophicum TaxID=1261403 RepID=A0A419VYM7_9BACT|nr:DUF5007 domain-containing protein [Mangrovibacterium diazotrophicum]RKD88259.1 uncharacterized protein DUF5007 [Mangrovibacterium diazotrophicum]